MRLIALVCDVVWDSVLLVLYDCVLVVLCVYYGMCCYGVTCYPFSSCVVLYYSVSVLLCILIVLVLFQYDI